MIFFNKKLVTFILVLASLNSFAQNTNNRDKVLKSIYATFNQDWPRLSTDSIGLYALNFSVRTLKTKSGSKVTSIVANDSLAYKLFPNYRRLTSINYAPLMEKKAAVTFIIPILIYCPSNNKLRDYGKEGTINIQAAVNAAYALSSTMPYDNLKHAQVPLNRRLMLYRGTNTVAEKEIIHLDPIIFELTAIK